MRYFNPHSREGSDIFKDNAVISGDDFNPHSREGSDVKSDIYYGDDAISIHTPAKGVTLRQGSSVSSAEISIHTPAKGVTKSNWR